MNLTLRRFDKREDGIFSTLHDEKGKQIAVTLEHAYTTDNSSYDAKLKPGIYKCVKGPHKLKVNSPSFDTFEITGVNGHWGILFHRGNFNRDSEGCVLLGSSYGGDPRMLYNSRQTFDRFMALQDGVKEFTLTVEG